MKKTEYVNNLNSEINDYVEEYVQKVYAYLKKNQISLPFRLPNDLEPIKLYFTKCKERFAQDGWNLTKKDNHDSVQGYSWTSYYLD